jgi:hypothetical protein
MLSYCTQQAEPPILGEIGLVLVANYICTPLWKIAF